MENASAAIVARAAAAASAADAAGGAVDAAAFRALYPAAYLERFLRRRGCGQEAALRPDGRRPATCRSATLALGALSRAAAAGSALVRLGGGSGGGAGGGSQGGSTAALAGVRLEVMCPTDAAPDRGGLAVAVEFAPLASPAGEASRAADAAAAAVVAERLRELLLGGGAGGGEDDDGLLDTRQLCIDPGRAAWAAYLDVVVLDAGGAAADACLLAALAALRHLRLPPVRVTEEGNVVRSTGEGREGGEAGEEEEAGRLTLRGKSGGALPASATTFAVCRLSRGGAGGEAAADTEAAAAEGKAAAASPDAPSPYADGDVVYLADPTAEEEALAQALVTVTVDGEGVRGVSVTPGGGGGGGGGAGGGGPGAAAGDGDAALLTPAALLRCVALARARGKDLSQQLEAAEAAAEAAEARQEEEA